MQVTWNGSTDTSVLYLSQKLEGDWSELEKGINLQFAKQCFIDHKRSKNEK